MGETPATPATQPAQGKGQAVKPEVFERVVGQLGSKPAEQIKAEVAQGVYPFAISEEKMRADLAEQGKPTDEKQGA